MTRVVLPRCASILRALGTDALACRRNHRRTGDDERGHDGNQSRDHLRQYMRHPSNESILCTSLRFDRRFGSIYSAPFMSGTRLIIAAAALGVSASVGTLSAQTQAPSPAAPPTFTSSVTETVDVAVHAVTTEHVGRPEIDARHARTLDEALDFTPGIRVRSDG